MADKSPRGSVAFILIPIMTEYPIATREMIKFKAELEGKNNENSEERQDNFFLQADKRLLRPSLVLVAHWLTEQKDEIEEKLSETEKDLAYVDVNAEFQKVWGSCIRSKLFTC